ncbi:MAG: hypothetical protein HYY00_04670 [Chloroflexi bacterium]|nr:hypothetical protein [Chloroflexota bacterium]
MEKGWRWLLPIAAVAGLVLMAACAGAEPTATPTPTPTKAPAVVSTPTPTATATPTGPKTGGILRAAYLEDPKAMDPHQTVSSFDRSWVYDVCDPLVNFTQDGVPDPKISLAQSWEISADGLTYTFKLRDAKFQDGTPVDADAVKFSLERVLDPKLNFSYRAQIKDIKEVQVVDPKTVRLTVGAPSAPFILNLGERGGMPISPTALKAKGQEKFTTEPVCAGAFQLREWQPGSFWEVRKHQDYWNKPLPYLDGIRYSVIPDGRVRVAAMEAGDADIAWLEESHVALVEKNPQLGVSRFLGYGFEGLKWNRTLPPMDNFQVRKAVSMLVDAEAINKSVYQNLWKVAKGGEIPDTLWAYADLTDVRPKYDPKGAADLIKQTGLSTPIPIKMVITSSEPRRTAGELVQGMLNGSGLFAVKMDVATQAESTRLAFDERSYPLTVTGIGLRVDPDGMLSISLTSESFYNPSRAMKDADQMEVDRLVAQAAKVFDIQQRKQLYAQAQRLSVEKLVSGIPFLYRGRFTGYRTWVKNIDTLVGADGLWRSKELWLDK